MQSRLNHGSLAKLADGPKAGQDLSRVGAGASRGANQGKKLNAAPWSGTWPAPGATLDLDFANDRGFVRGVGQGRSMDAVTFTRASVGRFVDQDGLLQEAANNTPRFDWASTAQVAQNLLRYTEEFDNAYWTKLGLNAFGSGSVVNTIATLDPFGGNTAEYIQENTVNQAHNVYFNSVVAGSPITLSVYVKAGGRTSCYIYTEDNPTSSPRFSFFNLSDGTYSGKGAYTAHTSYSITDAGNGWYRLSVVCPSISQLSFGMSTGTVFSYTGDGTSGIYIWGAQAEVGTSATAYKPNGAFAPSNTPLAANPTSNGLLIEEARTNRLLWNRDATDAAWVKTDVTAAKDQTGIDGVANAASSLTSTADNGTCIQTITLASGSRTGSVFLKRITGTGNVQVSLDGSTWSTVDLSDTEWRRIVLSGTVTNPTVGIKLLVSGDAVAMDYGQVEDGAFATSPILTTSASVTRSADFATMPTAQQPTWFDPGYGTIYAAGAIGPASEGLPLVGLGSGTGSLYRVGPNPTSVLAWWSGSALFTTANSAVWADGVRVAGSFNSSGRSLCLNGGPVAETGSTIPNTGVFNIGRNSNSGVFANGAIKQITYFNRRFANAALQALTGTQT
jgi:hypothetical protein